MQDKLDTNAAVIDHNHIMELVNNIRFMVNNHLNIIILPLNFQIHKKSELVVDSHSPFYVLGIFIIDEQFEDVTDFD